MARKAFNTGMFAEKVFALTTYDSTILTQTYQNPNNKRKIDRGAAFLVKNYFENYIDTKAKISPKSLHHIYEFDMTGNKTARLFQAQITDSPAGAVLSYSFKSSKRPNREGYVFRNKAQVMEDGEPITVRPKRSQFLRYRLEDGQFVTSRQSFIPEPGGPVKGNFQEEFNNFMTTRASYVLEKSSFYQLIERAIIGKRRLMIPRINSGMVSDAAAKAAQDAEQIAQGVNFRYV